MAKSPSSRGLITTPSRSALMRRVRREDTAPELRVRKALHAAGLRYSLHPRGLVGRPDLVLRKRRSVVFVHGCFWHGHRCARGAVRPKSNRDYWEAKIRDNRLRDRRQRAQLESLGWRVEVIWECQVREPTMLAALAKRLLAR